MELVYKANNLEIYYDNLYRFFHCNWIGYQNNEVLCHSGEIIHDLVMQRSITRILNNNTKVEGSWMDSAGWVTAQWFPDMTKAGLQYFAWILSPDAFAELSARNAVPSNGLIQIKLFEPLTGEQKKALDWLLNPKIKTPK